MRRHRPLRRRPRKFPTPPGRGFTLVEVLVAFAITALVATAALHLFDGGGKAGNRFAEASRALILAEAQLLDPANDALDTDPAERRGESDGFTWRVRLDMPADLPALQRMTATVRWERGSVTLSRYRYRDRPDE